MRCSFRDLIKVTALCAGSFSCATAAQAQTRAIDTAKSTLIVRVFKSGLLSGLGHDHEIAAPVAAGSVDGSAGRVELHANARSMKVADQKISDKDRAEIQSNMEGPQVLDSEHFPAIAFRSTSVEPKGAGAWTVNGNLTLHGQTRAVAVDVREAEGRYLGTSRFRQSDFGIKPIKIAGGAVQVRDEIRVEFDIQLTR